MTVEELMNDLGMTKIHANKLKKAVDLNAGAGESHVLVTPKSTFE